MRTILLGLICAISPLCANAQNLWQVSGNGAKGSSYLFGTHHVAPYSITDSIAGFNNAIKSVDAVIGEVNLIDIDSGHVQQLTLNHALAPTDSVLTSVLTAAQIDSLDIVLAKYTHGLLSTEKLAAMKPAMVSTMLAMYQTMTAFPDFDQNEQLDGKILNLGHELGKELWGFETIDEQLGFLFDIPISVQIEQLMSAVRNDGESTTTTKTLAEAYMSQNLQKISEIMSSEMENDSEFAKTLITERNSRWVNKLKEILRNKSVFVVVGCGHLPGNDGLIEQLKQLGFTVSPVK